MSSEKALAYSRWIDYIEAMTEKSNGLSGYVRTVLERARNSGLSDSEICRRAGIAFSTFVRIKSGKQSPTISTMDKIEAVIEREAEMKRARESSA